MFQFTGIKLIVVFLLSFNYEIMIILLFYGLHQYNKVHIILPSLYIV